MPWFYDLTASDLKSKPVFMHTFFMWTLFSSCLCSHAKYIRLGVPHLVMVNM